MDDRGSGASASGPNGSRRIHMLHKFRQRVEDEKGFTLIERQSIRLNTSHRCTMSVATCLKQRSKAQDAGAKSNARNTVSHVESCYANSQDYTKCDNAQLIANEQVPAGDLTDVVVTPNGAQGYGIVATSKSGTTFTIAKNPATGAVTRTCSNGG